MLQTLRYEPAGGPLLVHAVSGFMQPAVYTLHLWTRGEAQPEDLGGGVLLGGEVDVRPLPPPISRYSGRILQAVVTVSLLNGKRYAPTIRVLQDGGELGSDGVEKTTTRASIGIQFLFLLEEG
jgi:hypothetical protein